MLKQIGMFALGALLLAQVAVALATGEHSYYAAVNGWRYRCPSQGKAKLQDQNPDWLVPGCVLLPAPVDNLVPGKKTIRSSAKHGG